MFAPTKKKRPRLSYCDEPVPVPVREPVALPEPVPVVDDEPEPVVDCEPEPVTDAVREGDCVWVLVREGISTTGSETVSNDARTLGSTPVDAL